MAVVNTSIGNYSVAAVKNNPFTLSNFASGIYGNSTFNAGERDIIEYTFGKDIVVKFEIQKNEQNISEKISGLDLINKLKIIETLQDKIKELDRRIGAIELAPPEELAKGGSEFQKVLKEELESEIIKG